jgi:hypothetical protein
MTTKIKTPGITDANVTTDKLNLISTSGTPGATIKGTSGQTDGYLQLNCEENTHGIKLKSPPHSAAQSYTLTFPQSITNGYFLKTDGSGNLSFAEVNVDDTAWQSSIVTAATLSAVVGYGYWIDTTSNACTITLPASANVGDQIIFVDYARTWATNAVTINQNSLNFQGFTSPNPVYDTIGQSVHIVYSGATQGWIPNTDDDVPLETPQAYDIEYLVVAGGGPGGNGGGGGGGMRTATTSFLPGITLTATIGAGGVRGSGGATDGTAGGNSSLAASSITTFTSAGGGFGSYEVVGGNGGSGGGGGRDAVRAGGSGNTPSTSPSQGEDGGDGNSGGFGVGGSGGGGGASGVAGTNGRSPTAPATTGMDGGDGTQSSITGSATYYSGGGASGSNLDPPTSATPTPQGGAGGGGNGAGAANSNGSAGTTNTGGGGGGGEATLGGNGGSGVVILSMLTSFYTATITGSPTVSTSGSETILTFTGTGTYTA